MVEHSPKILTREDTATSTTHHMSVDAYQRQCMCLYKLSCIIVFCLALTGLVSYCACDDTSGML